jgi:outer membrane protein assembly factor BamB
VVAVILVPGQPSKSKPQPSGSNIRVQPPRAGSLAWTFPTGGMVRSSPAVVDGVVYVGSDDDNVYALNATTGRRLWYYPTGNLVESSPAVANGVVYVGNNAGTVYALRTSPTLSDTERKVWAYPTYYPVRSGPVVVDNVVYFGSESGSVYAVNTSGVGRWSYATGNWVVSNPTLTVVDGVVYFGNHSGFLYALDAGKGTLLRQYQVVTDAVMRRADARPAVANGVVYIGTDGGLYALKPSGATFSPFWHNPKDVTVVSGPVVTDGVVYVGSSDDWVYALDATTGDVRWSFRTGNEIFSSPVVSGNIVYIGSEDGKLYALNTGS